MLGTEITGRHLPGGIWGQNLFSVGKILPGGDRLSGLATSLQPGGAGASRQGLRALFGEAASKGKRNTSRSQRGSLRAGETPRRSAMFFALGGAAQTLRVIKTIPRCFQQNSAAHGENPAASSRGRLLAGSPCKPLEKRSRWLGVTHVIPGRELWPGHVLLYVKKLLGHAVPRGGGLQGGYQHRVPR